MYKVFYNDRIIFLSDKINQNLDTNIRGLYFRYDSDEELQKALDFFLQRTDYQTITIFHSDLEELFHKFTSCFEYREAAGGIVYNTKNQILFIHRLDHWDLPKGHLENGETPEQGAIREVEEECGVTNLIIENYLTSTFHIYHTKVKAVLKRTYWYKMNYAGNQTLVPQTEESITKAEWINPENILMIISDTYPSLSELISNNCL